MRRAVMTRVSPACRGWQAREEARLSSTGSAAWRGQTMAASRERCVWRGGQRAVRRSPRWPPGGGGGGRGGHEVLCCPVTSSQPQFTHLEMAVCRVPGLSGCGRLGQTRGLSLCGDRVKVTEAPRPARGPRGWPDRPGSGPSPAWPSLCGPPLAPAGHPSGVTRGWDSAGLPSAGWRSPVPTLTSAPRPPHRATEAAAARRGGQGGQGDRGAGRRGPASRRLSRATSLPHRRAEPIKLCAVSAQSAQSRRPPLPRRQQPASGLRDTFAPGRLPPPGRSRLPAPGRPRGGAPDPLGPRFLV